MTKKLCFSSRCISPDKVIGLVLLLLFISLPVRGYALEAGDAAPDFRAVTVGGKNISYYSQIKGKRALYLVFWTTW